MKSGKCCLLSSLVIIIGLGIGGYIFRDKIIHEYNKYWNSFESSVDENTTNNISDSSEEIDTTTIKLITTSTSTTTEDEEYTDPNSDSSSEEDLTTLVKTTEASTTTTSTTQPSSTVKQYSPVQNVLPGMQSTIPSTTKSSRIEGSGSGFRKSHRGQDDYDDEYDEDDDDNIVHSGSSE